MVRPMYVRSTRGHACLREKKRFFPLESMTNLKFSPEQAHPDLCCAIFASVGLYLMYVV